MGLPENVWAHVERPADAHNVKGAGVDLMRNLGDVVKAGDSLYHPHASDLANLEF